MKKPQTHEEWEASEKKRLIRGYLDFVPERYRPPIEAVMMTATLETISEHYPYRNNASDDCHTFS